MIHSDDIGELATALCAAQAEFTAIPKDSANPFFKSKYAGLPKVVEVASPILTTHGLSVTQLLGHDEAGDTLTTCLMHKSGQFIADTMHLRPVKDDPQAQGSATTYGRRYAYMAALGLVADEDDDGNAASAPSAASRSTPTTRRKPQGAATGGGSGAEGASPAPAADPDSSGPVTDDTLKQVGDLGRQLKLTPAQWREVAKEVGAEGKKPIALTEDQATWIGIKLTKMLSERSAA